MRAARRFALDLQERGLIEAGLHNCDTKAIVGRQALSRVRVELFGSLALTGHGHADGPGGAAWACRARSRRRSIRRRSTRRLATFDSGAQLRLLGEVAIPFHEDSDLLFLKTQTLPGHSNGMRYTAFDRDGRRVVFGHFLFRGRRVRCARRRRRRQVGVESASLPVFERGSVAGDWRSGEAGDLADRAGERKDMAG